MKHKKTKFDLNFKINFENRSLVVKNNFEELFNSDPFIISDIHFGHQMIIKYCERPNDWQDILIRNWNERIGKEDYILDLGDFALAHTDDMQLYQSFLNGKHYLLRGNHDRKNAEFFNSIGITLIKEKEIVWKNLIFSHRPVYTPYGFYNLHGHIHNLTPKDETHINCCCEVFNYTPTHLSDIIKKYNINMKGD